MRIQVFLAEILDSLLVYQDSEKALWMKKYMRFKFEFLGVSSPFRRKVLQKYKNSFLQFEPWLQREIIKNLFLQGVYREQHYLGLDFLKYLDIQLEDIALIQFLASQHSWWDSVDSLPAVFQEYCQTFPDQLHPITQAWLDTQNIWLIRILIDRQLKAKQDTDWDYLQNIILKTCHYEEFFIQSAIGWSLSEYSKLYPSRVIQFVKHNNLGKFASQRALEWIKKHPHSKK